MSYVINTVEDLERILRENPEWRERIRRLILSDELLELPQRFDRFVEEEFKPLKEEVQQLKRDVEQLKKDVEQLKRDVEQLKRDVEKLKQDVAWLKGEVMELKFADRFPAILGKVFRKLRRITPSELADRLYDAVDEGVLAEKEAEDALDIDLVAGGFIKKENKEVLIAVEVSFVVDREDVRRAFERAMVIGRAFGMECIPAVFGKEYTEGAQRASQELPVLVF